MRLLLVVAVLAAGCGPLDGVYEGPINISGNCGAPGVGILANPLRLTIKERDKRILVTESELCDLTLAWTGDGTGFPVGASRRCIAGDEWVDLHTFRVWRSGGGVGLQVSGERYPAGKAISCPFWFDGTLAPQL